MCSSQELRLDEIPLQTLMAVHGYLPGKMHRGPLHHSWTPWSVWWSCSEHMQCRRCRGRCCWKSQSSWALELPVAQTSGQNPAEKRNTPFVLSSCRKPRNVSPNQSNLEQWKWRETLSRTAWMISFLFTGSWVALAFCSCWTTGMQERIPMQSSPARQSSLTESGGRRVSVDQILN